MGAALSTILPSRARDDFNPVNNPRDFLLLTIYEPDCDIGRLPPRERKLRLERYNRKDLANIPPEVAPPYPKTEQSALELWRQQVDHQMTMRISRYAIRCSTIEQKTSVLRASRSTNRSEHQVFQIPELLDLILQSAGPQTQVRTLHVSTTVNGVLSQYLLSQVAKTWKHFASNHLLRPSNVQQIEQFGLHVDRMISWQNKSYSGPRYIYFPARLAQLDDLPNTIAQSLNELDVAQRNGDFHGSIHAVSRNTGLSWLDLSQFQINPYFDLLFSEKKRIQHRLGRWEICLRPNATPETLVLSASLSEQLLVRAIGSMYVTNPPCRCLGIYYYNNNSFSKFGTHELLKRIRNDNGIQVAELLDALNTCAPKLLAKWVEVAGLLRKSVTETGH